MINSLKFVYNKAIFTNEKTLYKYRNTKRGFIDMKKLSTKLSVLVASALFASMQIAYADGLANA